MGEILSKCPICLRAPHVWTETAKYGSRELYWAGCRTDGKLMGAVSRGVAVQLWEKLVARMKYEQTAMKTPIQLGRRAA